MSDNLGNTADGRSNAGKYQEIKEISTTAQDQFVTFLDLPKYDTSGNVIVYNVREDTTNASKNFTEETHTMTKKSGEALADVPKFTDGDRNHGYYASSVEYVSEQEITDKPYATEYHITNTLPMTK